MARYRPEIDGLRAVAVVPVILFHAGLEPFGGGFVGVDVFFVISGYLITAIIVDDLDGGRFSLLRFYERRARRILPALLFVVACCIPFALLWMSPALVEDFARSVIAVCLFASNILFWREANYFSVAAEFRPLLHTWSLAVEEQFYVFFPLFILAVSRFGKRFLLPSIIIAGFASFSLSEWVLRNDGISNMSAFYLPVTRAWELLVGSACTLVGRGIAGRQNDWLGTIGLALIVASVVLYHQDTPFPGAYALVPVAGTAFVLMFAGEGTRIGRLLSLPALVGIGLVSYSAHLWHQPLFAFLRLQTLSAPPTWQLLVFAALAFVLGFLTWRFIEQPFRIQRLLPRRAALFGTGTIATIAIAGAGVAGVASNGLPGRYVDARDFIDHFENAPPERRYTTRIGILRHYRDECNFYIHDTDALNRAKLDIPESCTSRTNPDASAVFIWGDSYAQMLRPGLEATLPQGWELLQVGTAACTPSVVPADDRELSCRKSNERALKAIEAAAPEVVVLSTATAWSRERLSRVLDELARQDVAQVVVVGPPPVWLLDLYWVLTMNWQDLPERTTSGLHPDSFDDDETLESMVADLDRPGVAFVSLVDILCDADGCLTYLGGKPRDGITAWDRSHFTPLASAHVARSGLADAVYGSDQ